MMRNDDAKPVEPAVGPIRLGYWMLVPCLAALVLWSVLAPLGVAAVANGEFVVELKRRSVQHLEGGMVEKIFVREGEAVQKDAPLLAIADLTQRTQIEALLEKISSGLAIRARLRAELDGAEEPDFSDLARLDGLDPDRRRRLVALHGELFKARTGAIAARLALIRSQQSQAKIEKASSEVSKDFAERKLVLARQEYESIDALYKKNITTLSRKLEVEKMVLDLESQIEAAGSAIEKYTQAIASADLEWENTRSDGRRAMLEELQTTELSLQDWTGMLATVRDDVQRRIVRAPVSGRVMDLQVHTHGAVIPPGGRVLDIVPDDERVIVDARVSPNDIDIVHRGTAAKVVLSAYKAKRVPRLDGTVISLSADAMTDPAHGERYYLARIEIDEVGLNRLKEKIELSPGMPAQVFLLGTERTFFDYITQPIFDATYRAFREE